MIRLLVLCRLWRAGLVYGLGPWDALQLALTFESLSRDLE